MEQPKTSVGVVWGVYDANAKKNATFTASSDNAMFVDPALPEFKSEFFRIDAYATMEQDYWKLDGSFRFFPESPGYENQSFGTWGSSIFGGGVTLSSFNAPRVQVTFSAPVACEGITVRFDEHGERWPLAIRTGWTVGGSSFEMDFEPDAAVYFIDMPVEGLTAFSVQATKSTQLNSWQKITGIDFGQVRTLSDDIVSVRILEEINPTSAELRINTCEVQFIDRSINILNPTGAAALFKKRQPIDVQGVIDGTAVEMGAFFLSEWENGLDGVHTMRAISLLGMMDGTQFDGGVYTNIRVDTLIQRIFTAFEADSSRYTLDGAIGMKTLTGWLPVCTPREALQQVLFAVGAQADCSRGDRVVISAPADTLIGITRQDRRGYNQELYQSDTVDGVIVLSHSYTQSEHSTEQTLIDADLEVGIHRFNFDAPMYDKQVDFDAGSGNTVQSEGDNFVVLNIVTAGYVYMTGFPYLDTTQSFTMGDTTNDFGANILRVEDATLISPAIGNDVARRVYAYYSMRHINKYPVRLNDYETIGGKYRVLQDGSTYVEGRMVALDIDASGGFYTMCEVRGDIING